MADLTPITRKERYLAKAGGQEATLPPYPITREERYLEKIANGGGTSDYTDLTNKPKINNVTLDGNKSWADLGLSNPMHIAGRVNTVNDLPATANEGDVYLVGLVSDTEKAEYVYVSGSWEYLGKNTIEIDDAMSSTSENPVQNKVITGALSGKQSEITAQNPLSADLVDDSTASHKFVTAAEKTSIGTSAEKLAGIAETDDDYIELENGTRLYISNTAPTGTIPEGSVGIGW